MSEIHIRRIKKYLDDHVCGLIDTSDFIGKSQAEKDASVYSRSLAAFSLMELAQCTAYDSVRGVFWEGDDLYPGAGFKEKNHIQIAIINPNCIKGFFLPRDVDNMYLIP